MLCIWKELHKETKKGNENAAGEVELVGQGTVDKEASGMTAELEVGFFGQ